MVLSQSPEKSAGSCSCPDTLMRNFITSSVPRGTGRKLKHTYRLTFVIKTNAKAQQKCRLSRLNALITEKVTLIFSSETLYESKINELRTC